MGSDTFITIDDRSISLRQAMTYLDRAGELPRALQTILQRYLVEEELKSRDDIEVEPDRLEQLAINFRLQNRLTEPQRFEQWLQSQKLSYDGFRERLAENVKIDKLKAEIAAPDLQGHFERNKPLLDRVILARLITGDRETAERLKQQALSGEQPFEALIREHSIASDRASNGITGALTMGQLPEPVRAQLQGKDPGTIVGPIEAEGRYAVVRVEQWIPATLEGDTKRRLQQQLFERWVQQKLQNRNIKMHLGNPEA